MVDHRQSGDEQSDEELMAAIADGQAAALHELYLRYAGTILALCHRVLGDRHDAEDVALEVFWEIWQKSARFNPSRSSARAYLMMMARSRAIDSLRRAGGRRRPLMETLPAPATSPHAADGPGPLHAALIEEDRQRVCAVLAELDSQPRQMLDLAFYQGLSHRQIAEQLRVPLGTIKSRIRNALRQLRFALQEAGEDIR